MNLETQLKEVLTIFGFDENYTIPEENLLHILKFTYELAIKEKNHEI